MNCLNTPMRNLTWSFLLSVLCVVAVVAQSEISKSYPLPAWLFLLILSVLLIAGIVYYVSLGILAKRLGKSWITWIGLTVITKPFGPVVAYFLMRRLVLGQC